MPGPPAAGAAPPSLALGQFFATGGVAPEPSGQGPATFTMGMVHGFAGGSEAWVKAPFGMPPADGGLLEIREHPGLFNVIGTSYGGEVPINFNLPDLRGRAATQVAAGPTEAPSGTLAMMWLICADGASTTPPPSPPPPKLPPGFPPPPPTPPLPWFPGAPITGMVALYAGSTVPHGWLACDGSLIAESDHPALHAAIGRAFGWEPDGRVALPNLVDQVIVGTPAGTVPGQSRGWIPGDTFATEPPSLALRWLINIKGSFPLAANVGVGVVPAEEGWLGQLIAYAGTDIPSGWAACDGALLPIAQYQELFVLLETSYGGDGETSFALPDLGGTMVVGR